MVKPALLLQLSLWAAAANAFHIWEPCRVSGTCESPKGKSVESRAEARRSQPLTLEIHHRPPPSRRAPVDQARRDARRLSGRYNNQGRRSAPDDVALPHKSTNQYSVMVPAKPELENAVGIYQDGNDYAYFVQAKIGSAKQPMYMLLDTGAGTSWVMGSDCGSEPCDMHDTFDVSTSDSHKDPGQHFSVSYGSGAVKGANARDTISVGGVDVTMEFGVANDTSDDFKHFPFDGILGMSMSEARTDNFPLKLKESGELEDNVFSIFLDRGSSGENRGELVLGGINKDKYTGDIGYTSIEKGSDEWAIPIDGVGFGDKSLETKSRVAYIDSGTSFAFAAKGEVKALHELIPGSKTDDGVYWRVPCDTEKEVTFTFSGKRYAVSPEDYVSPSPGGGLCKSNIYGQEVVKGGWLLGDVFLKNVYAVFDMDKKRIGFASRAAEKSTSKSTTPTSSGSGSSSSGTSSPDSSSSESGSLVGGPESSGAGGDAEGAEDSEDSEDGDDESGQSGVVDGRMPLWASMMGVAAAVFLF